nr:MAG TPA: tail fiber protein [Caudoviricetes sp.]
MTLSLIAANNAQSVLAAGINASATSLALSTGTGSLFPSPVSGETYFKLTLIDAATEQLNEVVHVTARSGDALTIVRGQEGTTARAWSASDIAANMMTAGSLAIFAQYGTVDFLNATAGRLINVQIFSNPGTFTYNATPGTNKQIVEVLAAGGPGGNASASSTSTVGLGSGGGAGSYAKSFITSAILSQTVVVGAGGVNGVDGGLSSFGSIVANGGTAGGNNFNSTWSGTVTLSRGGAAGTASGGNIINANGYHGENAIFTFFGNCVSGAGGGSIFSGGGLPVGGSAGPGNPGNLGSGGSGANATGLTTLQPGGKGGDGLVIIWEYA